MPQEADQLRRLRDNIDFLNANMATAHIHWLVTTSYYCALHLVDAHLSKLNIHPPSHEKRKEVIEAGSRFPKAVVSAACYGSYCLLEKLSRRARYMCNENGGNRTDHAHQTELRHVQTAMQHLATVVAEIEKIHAFGISIPSLKPTASTAGDSSALTTSQIPPTI